MTAVGRNLYTWTKYTGWDPDVGAGGGQTRIGRALLGAVLELSADAQLHAHALIQVLTRQRTGADNAARGRFDDTEETR